MADGFVPFAEDPARDSFAPTFLIAALDAARREAAMAPPPPAPPAPPMPDPLEEQLAEARRIGHAAGRAEALAEASAAREAQVAQALRLGLEILREGRAAAAEVAERAAQGIACLALSMLDAALPGLAARNGPALAAAFAERLAPCLATEPEARLFVAPGLGAETRALLGDLEIAVEEDPALRPGDARAEWRAGGAAFDLAARRGEIGRLLESAGIGLKE